MEKRHKNGMMALWKRHVGSKLKYYYLTRKEIPNDQMDLLE